MFDKLKTIRKYTKEIRRNQLAYEGSNYYSDINEIPLLNWWKCSKGDLSYLWRKKENWIPVFFKKVFSEIYYQFDYIELDELRRTVRANYYENKYHTTQNLKYKQKAMTIAAEAKMLASESNDEVKLNDLIKFVQKVLQLNYYPDATQMSAGYFFNLYNEAKLISEKNGNN